MCGKRPVPLDDHYNFEILIQKHKIKSGKLLVSGILQFLDQTLVRVLLYVHVLAVSPASSLTKTNPKTMSSIG